MRKKLCDIIGELAHNMIDDEGNNKWPEFLQFLFESACSPTITHKEVALTLFRYALCFMYVYTLLEAVQELSEKQ